MKPIHAMGLIWMALLFFSAQGCSSNSKVFQKDPSSFRLIGTKGTGPGQFDGPTDLAFSPPGNVIVVDWGNHRLQSISLK